MTVKRFSFMIMKFVLVSLLNSLSEITSDSLLKKASVTNGSMKNRRSVQRWSTRCGRMWCQMVRFLAPTLITLKVRLIRVWRLLVKLSSRPVNNTRCDRRILFIKPSRFMNNIHVKSHLKFVTFIRLSMINGRFRFQNVIKMRLRYVRWKFLRSVTRRQLFRVRMWS